MVKLKLNLAAIGGKIVQNKKGQKFIQIPFDSRYMFAGKKAIYIDLVAWENDTSFATHQIKPDLNEEDNKKVKEQGKFLPIVGNFLKFQKQEQSTEAKQPTTGDDIIVPDADDEDDLPF